MVDCSSFTLSGNIGGNTNVYNGQFKCRYCNGSGAESKESIKFKADKSYAGSGSWYDGK